MCIMHSTLQDATTQYTNRYLLIMKNRKRDIERFYSLLEFLESKSSKKLLMSCSKSDFPEQGIYFFFENSETRENGKPRVVRIGTHAVSKGSKATYWNRLKQHKGTNNGFGNHRGSVFRKLIGQSIIEKNNLNNYPFWGKKIKKSLIETEKEHELKVSQYLGKMPFLTLNVPGQSSKYNDRAYIETNSIALISNLNKEKIDKPSENWLGYFSKHKDVIESGLWNSDDTEKNYVPDFLDKLEQLIIKQ